jgi:hypothetical protein
LLLQKVVLHNRNYFVLWSAVCLLGGSTPWCRLEKVGLSLGCCLVAVWASPRAAVEEPNKDGGSVSALIYDSLIAIALLVAASLVAGFFAYIHSLKRQ